MIDHECGKNPYKREECSPAIVSIILNDGVLWAGNREYGSIKIFFCPWCGKSKEDIEKDGS